MRKTIGIALIVAAICATAAPSASAAPAERRLLVYKLTGNLTGVAGGDYNDRILGENSYLRAVSTSMTGAYEELKNGLGFQFEVMLPLGRRLAVGVGGGYYRIRCEGTIDYSGTSDGTAFNASSTLIPRLSIMPFFINLHYLIELGPKIVLDAYAGPLFQLVQYNVENPSTSTLLNTVQTVTFTASATAPGVQAGLGASYSLLKGVAVVADVLYRTGSVTDLFGNWAKVGTSDAGTIAGSSAEYYLWGFDSTAGGTHARAGYYDKDGPTEAGAANFSKATIALNGLTLQAGLRISF
jgi:hypothetical protein